MGLQAPEVICRPCFIRGHIGHQSGDSPGESKRKFHLRAEDCVQAPACVSCVGAIGMFELTLPGAMSKMTAWLDPKLWLAILALAVASFAAGWLTKAHYVAVDEAKVEAKQEVITTTVEKVVTVTDDKKVKALQKALSASEARLAELSGRIAEEANERPAAVSCRVSDGLRDALNGDLTGRTR